MIGIKYKEFAITKFVDFIFDLVDKQGLSQVIFYPDKKELFDDYQLTHIAPNRNEDDSRGFAWAWSKKLNEIRNVTFSQFNADKTKSVNITISLNQSVIKLNEIEGISTVGIEDLVKKRFGFVKYVSDRKYNFKAIFQRLRDISEIKKLLFRKEIVITIIFAILTASSAPWWWSPFTKYIKETGIIESLVDIKIKHFTNYNDPSRVLDNSIYNIVQEMDALSTVQEKQSYIQNYSGMVTKVESGRIIHATTTEGLTLLADIDVNSKVVTCDFDKKWRKKFSILGGDAYVQFHGVVDRYDANTGKLLLFYCTLYYR